MAAKIYECIEVIGNKIIENKDFLTDLDRLIGDADHGINMARGYTEVLKTLDQENTDIGAVLKDAGKVLIKTVGGASGPLYGTAYMKAGKVMNGKTEVTAEDAKAMMDAIIGGIKLRGKAEQGEKTMLDSMFPAKEALDAALAAGEDGKAALAAAVKAAEEGIEYTKTIIATKGRASYLGERSLGHQDPGATSFTLMLKDVADLA